MKDKSNDNNKSSTEEVSSLGSAADDGIVVEEQVLERHEYDSTTSFKMDIEKAKAMATSQRQTGNEQSAASVQTPVDTGISEEEKARIKQSLAELREIEDEQGGADDHSRRRGLFGRIKSLFGDK